ncbi:hypothetical protein ACFX1X_036624 [Malus domestica]
MAAIRLDEKPDNIENVLVSSLVDGTVSVSSSQNRKLGPSNDPLASSSWEEVSSKDTLITPAQYSASHCGGSSKQRPNIASLKLFRHRRLTSRVTTGYLLHGL